MTNGSNPRIIMYMALTRKQNAYVKHRARGLPREQSAILAGMATNKQNTHQMENLPVVAEELARIRAETAANAGVTKEDVVALLEKAALLAISQGDAQGLVAAARELGKMLGYYAVEVKKTLIGYDKEGIKKALAEMTDEELYKVANARTIEGESKRIPELEPPKKV